MDINKEVSAKLKEAYMKAGLSYAQLEKITGLSRSTIFRIVNCTTQKIDIDKMQIIAEALGISPDYVMGWCSESDPINIAEKHTEAAKIALFGGSGEVTDEMWDEVTSFVEYVKQKHKKDQDKKE